jgi:hypothetical protein
MRKRKALSIEDLLKAESVDWDALSKDPDQLCNSLEVKYFAKEINWSLYLLSHRNTINTTILEYGSKYFKPKHYSLACQLEYIDENFVRKHIDSFNFRDIILFCKVSDDFLIEYLDYWKNIPNITDTFKKSRWFTDSLYPQTSVILKTL